MNDEVIVETVKPLVIKVCDELWLLGSRQPEEASEQEARMLQAFAKEFRLHRLLDNWRWDDCQVSLTAVGDTKFSGFAQIVDVWHNKIVMDVDRIWGVMEGFRDECEKLWELRGVARRAAKQAHRMRFAYGHQTWMWGFPRHLQTIGLSSPNPEQLEKAFREYVDIRFGEKQPIEAMT